MAELELSPVTTLPRTTVDIVVIGAGVAGLSAALSARAAGAQMIVLEKANRLGYGATGRNAGILSAGINMSISDIPPVSPGFSLWSETAHVLLSLVDEAAQPGSILSARLTGALSLAESKHAARHLEREARARVAAGLRAELWTSSQALDVTTGRLNVGSVISVLWLPDEGRIHPLTLLAHLARQARAAGIQLVGKANKVVYEEIALGTHSHLWCITLSDGRIIRASALISAVGPIIQPNARIYALAFAADLPENFPLFRDASPYTYADFRPGDGRLSVSGGRYGRAGVTRHDNRYYRRLADAARRWLPELSDREPLYTWAVDLAVTPDMIPELRTLGQVTSGVAIEGLGALGVLPGIVLGRRAGEIMTR